MTGMLWSGWGSSLSHRYFSVSLPLSVKAMKKWPPVGIKKYNKIQYNIREGNSVAFLCSKQNVSHHSTYLPALNTISVVIKRSWFPYTFNDTESCSQRVTEWKVELRTPTKHDHTVCAAHTSVVLRAHTHTHLCTQFPPPCLRHHNKTHRKIRQNNIHKNPK